MCSIICYGNIHKDTNTLSYFLLYYYIVILYLLVPGLATGAPQVASCVWPYTILTHLGGVMYIYIYIYMNGMQKAKY